MYGLTSELVNAKLADRQREAGRVALENTVAIRPAGENPRQGRLATTLGRALAGVRRERRPVASPVVAN